MSLEGLPDWSAPLGEHALGARLHVPYGGDAPCTLTPARLTLATRAGGGPDFRFDLLRQDDGAKPLQGLLAFRVEAEDDREAALEVLRERLPHARLRSLPFDTGFLRLVPAGASVELAAPLRAPLPLTWNGLGSATFHLMMRGDTAPLFEAMLARGTLLLSAYAEMERTGVAPRVPLQVRLDPARLVPALASRVGGLQAGREAFVQAFLDPWEPLGLEVTGRPKDPDAQTLAETLTDWLRVRLGRFVPAPVPDGDGWLALPEPGSLAPALHLWDLATPLAAPRPVTLSLGTFEAVEQLVRERGLDAVLHRRQVPGLALGGVPLSIWAAVPRGLDATLGVSLHAPPTRHRPQALWSGELTLREQDDHAASHTLRLSPAEPIAFRYRTHAELADGTFLESAHEVATQGPTLSLGPEDFPVALRPVEASPRLLREARLTGHVQWPEPSGTPTHVDFELTPERPQRVFVLPKDRAAQARLLLEARERHGPGTLRLELPLDAASSLDLMSFPGFGPQRIEVGGAFAEGGSALRVELRGEDPTPSTTLLLTRQHPSRSFSWFADSPFRSGYVYRRAGSAEWSTPQPPTQPLRLAPLPAESSS